jgi:hypothetical protein
MAWLTSILQNVGRTGSDINEAKTANLQEKQQKLAQQFKMQQFKAQMDELNQRLATGKAPQYLGSYQATTGQRFNTQRNPLSGAITEQASEGPAAMSPEQKKIADAETALGRKLSPEEAKIIVGVESKTPKTAYAAMRPDANGKMWGLNAETKQWEPLPEVPGSEFKAVQKPQNRDDKYIAIQAKKNGNTPLTKEEKDYEAAYDLWTKKTKIDPGIQRAAAFSANRYIPIIDPSDPEAVTFMRAYDAAKSGARSPQSIAFQTDKAITKYFTAGPAGTTINYFNTAIDHLKLLRETADALQNGDFRLLNEAGNRYANETGNPAPNNFNTVRSAVAGELSKTFKGTGATDQEVSMIQNTINNAQSPKQMNGAIEYYLRLMGGKMDALKGQYEAGKRSTPNFGGNQPPPGAKIIKWDDVK